MRVQNIDIIYASSDDRVIAFRRSAGSDDLLVVASLNNHSFDSYNIQTDAGRLPDGSWQELFNSNSSLYGGDNNGNGGESLPVSNGLIQMTIPANSVLVFVKV